MSLQAAVRIVLSSDFPMMLHWGPELITVYNDAYAPSLGNKHPGHLGGPAKAWWPELWDHLSPIFAQVLVGKPFSVEDAGYTVDRDGTLQEAFFTHCHSPLWNDDGQIAGIFLVVTETTKRVQLTRALRESEQQLDALIRSSSEVRYQVNADWSVLSELTGGSFIPSTTGNPDWFEAYIPPEARGEVWTEIARAVSTKTPFSLEHQVNRVDGSIGWTSSCAVPLLDDAGQLTGWYGAASDVTARHQAESALQELNATLEQQIAIRTEERDQLWRLSRDPFVISDLKGVWLSASPVWTEILGWSQAELIGRTSAWMEHPEDYDKTREEIVDLAAGAVTLKFTNRFRDRSGAYHWFAWTAVAEGDRLICVARDISQERKREAVLRDAQDFARLAMAAVGGVGVWTFEIANDQFFYDAAIASLYGLDKGRGVVGIPRHEFLANVHPDDVAGLRATMSDGLERAGDVEMEYRIRHPDGSIRYVLSRGYTYLSDKGEPVRRTGVGVDLTSQRQTEEALRQSSKMEAVGQLTGGLAHDFNNLLAVITGSLDLMGRRLAQNRVDQLEKFMDAAQTAAKRAASLTHRLLAFSRRQTLDPKPTNVSNMVEGMQDMINRTVGPEISVAIVPKGSIWTTLVDPSQLENALLNLCINARDAMPDGGRITVETANLKLSRGQGASRDMLPGQYVALSVSDNGTGMPPEVITRVFEPFYTTKAIGQGTGLGLSMVYGFAKQSGGQVRIHSEVGRGTTVTIYLPRSVTDIVAEQPGESPMPERMQRGQTVLVVDDEAHIRMLIADVLNDLNCEVLEAENGQSGLNILREAQRIDLLITDVGMPGGMNGRQLADAARMHRPTLKTLFITGYAETAAFSHGHLEPGMSILTKPFAIDVLANRVKEMIEAASPQMIGRAEKT